MYAFIFPIHFKSAPAQKALPWPVRTNTRAPGVGGDRLEGGGQLRDEDLVEGVADLGPGEGDPAVAPALDISIVRYADMARIRRRRPFPEDRRPTTTGRSAVARGDSSRNRQKCLAGPADHRPHFRPRLVPRPWHTCCARCRWPLCPEDDPREEAPESAVRVLDRAQPRRGRRVRARWLPPAAAPRAVVGPPVATPARIASARPGPAGTGRAPRSGAAPTTTSSSSAASASWAERRLVREAWPDHPGDAVRTASPVLFAEDLMRTLAVLALLLAPAAVLAGPSPGY